MHKGYEMETNYDVYATLGFQQHYGKYLATNIDETNRIYRSYWQFVNQLIYGKRNTDKFGIKTEVVQQLGELDTNPHIHVRVKTPNHLSIKGTCMLLNTIWKDKFYEKAKSPKYNHITPILDTDKVYGYNTRGTHYVDEALSNKTLDENVKFEEASHTRILNYLQQPHIGKLFNEAQHWYPYHVQHSQRNF